MPVSEAAADEVVRAVSGLVRTVRSYAQVHHEQLGPTGLSVAALARLSAAPARSGDLARALGVSPSAVSRAVATLERLGYVRRTPDPVDARAHVVTLSADGRTFLAAQHREHARRVATALDGWDDARARCLLDGLAELDAALSRSIAEIRTRGIPAVSPVTDTRNQQAYA